MTHLNPPRPVPRPPSLGAAEVVAHPSLSDLEADCTVVWTELSADLAPWMRLGLHRTEGEPYPCIALMVSEDATNWTEVVATPGQMLGFAQHVIDLCHVIPYQLPGARGEAAHREAG